MRNLIKIFKKHPDITAAFVLLFLILLFFGRLFYPEPKIFATAEIGINDIWDFNYPLRYFLSNSLKQNHIPLWNPYRANGFPELAESQVGTFNLYNLLAFKFLPPIIAFNLGFCFIFFTTAFGFYLFIKRQGFSILYSFFGSLLYAFSGFFITHISHFLLIQTASFFPFLLYFTDKILKDKTNKFTSSIFFALILSQQLFSGNPQTVFISSLAILMFSLFFFFTHQTNLKSLFILSWAFICGVIISAAQLLPTLELAKLSLRGGGLSPNEILFYKFPFKHILTLINPFLFGNPQIGTYPHFSKFNGSIFWENTGYIGLIPLGLAIASLYFIRRKREIFLRFFWFLLIISLLFMAGGDSPLYFLLLLPPFSYFRFPSRFLIIFLLALVSLALYGLHLIMSRIGNITRRKWVTVSLIILSLFNIFGVWWKYHPVIPYQEFAAKPQIINYLDKVPHGTIYTYLANARAFTEFFKWGSQHPQDYLELRNELVPNLNVLFKTRTTNTYSSLSPGRLALYSSDLASTHEIATSSTVLSPLILRKLSIRNTTHIVSPIPLTNNELTLDQKISLRNNLGDLFIYINKSAASDYYFINQPKYIQTFEEFEQTLVRDDFDLKTQAILETEVPSLNNTQKLNSKITVVNEQVESKTIQTESNTPAVLVVNQTFYPGWKATIDNIPSTIFPVNLVSQGLTVPAGKHKIHLFFAPQSFFVGLWITIIGYTCSLLIILIKMIRKVQYNIYGRKGKFK